MHITVLFQFNHESDPAAETGIRGDVTDILLPFVGDLVRHADSGHPFQGKVTDRIFKYDVPVGQDIEGSITVTLCLDRTGPSSSSVPRAVCTQDDRSAACANYALSERVVKPISPAPTFGPFSRCFVESKGTLRYSYA